MRQILQRAAIFTLVAAAIASAQESRPAQRGGRNKVLFLTHSAGFVHDVVKRPAPDQLSFAEKELTEILKGHYQLDCTQDCSVLMAEKLKAYDVVAFYTTGELPAPPGGAQALIDWVRRGGGFAGIHCAADTWYTVPAYGEMLGGVFESHPWNEEVEVRNETPFLHRLGVGDRFRIADEIYQFKHFSRTSLSVWLSLDPASVDATKGSRDDHDYALAWGRGYGDGHVFYTGLGHRETAWKDERFRKHLRYGFGFACSKEALVWRDAAPGAKILVPSSVPGAAPAFAHRDGSQIRWNFETGILYVVPKTGDIISKDKFGDCSLHVEFCVPVHPPEDKGQARGNSGVYLQDRYEIQVLDSYGLQPKADDCGAIYGKKAPSTNACRKAGEWQNYDVRFTAARFNDMGKKIANARATVWQNGIKIHDDVEIDGPTGGGEMETPEPGPIRLQDHGDLVQYRNIWVVPR